MFDEKLLDGLNVTDLHLVLKLVLDHIQKIDEEDPDREDDPRIDRLLKVVQLITDRMDPLVREHIRDKPEALAEWDEIMHSCDDLNDDLDEQLPADIESPSIS